MLGLDESLWKLNINVNSNSDSYLYITSKAHFCLGFELMDIKKGFLSNSLHNKPKLLSANLENISHFCSDLKVQLLVFREDSNANKDLLASLEILYQTVLLFMDCKIEVLGGQTNEDQRDH